MEYSYLYHGRLWEYFHNCIYSPSLLSSSTIEGFTGMPCLDWSLRRCHYTAIVCGTHIVSRMPLNWSLSSNRLQHHRLPFFRSINAINHRHQCGQTSRCYPRAEVQTSCNCMANKNPPHYFLDHKHGIRNNVLPLFWCHIIFRYCFYFTVYSNLNFLLRENMLCSSSSPGYSTTTRLPRRRKKAKS